jgi:hypothetical protein
LVEGGSAHPVEHLDLARHLIGEDKAKNTVANREGLGDVGSQANHRFDFSPGNVRQVTVSGFAHRAPAISQEKLATKGSVLALAR